MMDDPQYPTLNSMVPSLTNASESMRTMPQAARAATEA